MTIKNITKIKLHILIIICSLIMPAQQALATTKGKVVKKYNTSHSVTRAKAKVAKKYNKPHVVVRAKAKVIKKHNKSHSVTRAKAKVIKKHNVLPVIAQKKCPAPTVVEPKTYPDSKNYIGTDVSYISKMIKAKHSDTFQSNYGKNAFPNNPALYAIYLGHKFNDRFGVEVGYETQNKKSRTATLGSGDPLPGGTIVPAGDSYTLATQAKTQHIEAVLHITTYTFEKNENINIWTQIGASYSQIQAMLKPIADTYGTFTQATIDNNTITFKQWKLIPVAYIGINYNWTNRIGLRATAGWRHLSMIKPKSQENPSGEPQIKLRDGVNFGVGFYIKL